MVKFAPTDMASTLSSLIPNSKYKKYGLSRVVVYISGSLLKWDHIIAILKGRSLYSKRNWKISTNVDTNAKWTTVVEIKFKDKEYANEPEIKEFLQRESEALQRQGGELIVS